MWGRSYGVRIELLFVLQNINIISLCLFSKIKNAMSNCVLDFFYTIKEKHCRSPPSINSKIWIDWRKENAIRSR